MTCSTVSCSPRTIGSQWQRFADAWKAGVQPSLHNDGAVSPPIPLLNIQAAVTRATAVVPYTERTRP